MSGNIFTCFSYILNNIFICQINSLKFRFLVKRHNLSFRSVNYLTLRRVFAATVISAYLNGSQYKPKGILVNIKTFINNKKIHCIPPIYNNNYITDFREKTQILNNFFSNQCTLVENISKLPTDSFKRTKTFRLSRLLKMIL